MKRAFPSAVVFSVCATLALMVAPSRGADAPETETGILETRVTDTQGKSVTGVSVILEGPRLARTTVAATRSDGRVRFLGLPAPGRYVVSLATGGREPVTVELAAGETRAATLVFEPSYFEKLTVSESRASERISETPATVGVIDRGAIAATQPTHPGQLLGQVAGVWVSTTGGEGHQTAIRQPLTTNPVYLYLEDGVPTRSTGFFNHNALYEINVPMADSVEVTKGPGSALYGSDAIGGVVNVLTRSPFGAARLEASTDAGSFGWRRGMLSGNLAGTENAARADVNITQSDGWRDDTAYDRQSATLRFDRAPGGSTYLKALVTYSHIDQQTAGSSPVPEVLYLSDPEVNLTPISLRKVEAFRASVDWELQTDMGSFSVIPYYRDDSMELLPNWTLTFEPTLYTDANESYGLLAKFRRGLPAVRTELTAGVDAEWSPGSRGGGSAHGPDDARSGEHAHLRVVPAGLSDL